MPFDETANANEEPESTHNNNDETEEQTYEIYCAYNSLATFENDLNELFGLDFDRCGSSDGSSATIRRSRRNRLHPSIASMTPIPNIDFGSDNCMANIKLYTRNEPIDIIVHLAALSSPAYCEYNAEIAWRVNCPMELYNWSVDMGTPIIYLSTDQVYEGTKQFYQEDGDETLPVNVYGRSKLAFERVLLRGLDSSLPLLSEQELGGSSSCRDCMNRVYNNGTSGSAKATENNFPSIILRSSLILGPSTPLKHGCRKGSFPSFLQFVQHRLEEKLSTDYFSNEFRSVVSVNDVIDSIRHFMSKALFVGNDDDIGNRKLANVTVETKARAFNMGGSERVSRHDIAMAVANHLELDPSSIQGVDRPANNEGGVPSPPDISMDVRTLTKELEKHKMNGLQNIVASTFDANELRLLPPLYRYASKKLERSNYHITFSPDHEPALHVKPGELVHVETWDCFHGAYFEQNNKKSRGNAIDGEGDNANVVEESPQPISSPEKVTVDHNELNPVTGPIYIEGAMPGDILSVTIHDIRPKLRGVASNYGPGGGQLGHLVCKSCIRYFDISSDRKMVVMNCDKNIQTKKLKGGTKSITSPLTVSFPCQPMLGVIGLAPQGTAEVSTMPAGKHGGNLDNKINTIGSTIHIRVNHPGGLLSIGDMHASQGDGEICGTGVEISGDVLLSCSIIKNEGKKNHLHQYPVTETDTHWVTHGVAVEDIPVATTIASQEAASLLVDEWGFTMEDACIFLGVAGDLGLCQAIHPDKGTVIAKMAVPKTEACPRPYQSLVE